MKEEYCKASNVQTSITALQDDCHAEKSSTVLGVLSAKAQPDWVNKRWVRKGSRSRDNKFKEESINLP